MHPTPSDSRRYMQCADPLVGCFFKLLFQAGPFPPRIPPGADFPSIILLLKGSCGCLSIYKALAEHM
jgi:hypothetical protein